MRFYKLLIVALVIVVTPNLIALASSGEPAIDMEALKELSLQRQQEVIDSGVLKDISENATQSYKDYEAAAKMARTRSLLDMRGAMTDYDLMTEEEANRFAGGGNCAPGEGGDEDSSCSRGGVPNETRQIYVSFSMSDAELLNVFRRAYQQDAIVFFKGLRPDMRLIDEMNHAVGAITSKLDGKIPTIRFNPTGFEAYDVNSAPSIVYVSGGRYTKAEGILGFDFLKEKHETLDKTMDLGAYGATREVIERSLLEEIEERYANLDGEKLKERAINNFWPKQQFTRLPEAESSQVHFIDPTVKVSKDITNPQGQVLAYAGTVINPLAQNPVNTAYIVFNPKSEQQMEWALKWLNENQSDFHRVMVIASEIHKENGWDHLSEVRDYLRHEIFILPKEMKDRFAISAVPTIVSTDLTRNVLRVEQVKIGELK